MAVIRLSRPRARARAEDPEAALRRISFGIFLVALVTLMVELLLTRVFDVLLVPNVAYLIITCALFSFGLPEN